MSIENNLASIAKSLESIAKSLEARQVTPATAPVATMGAAKYEPPVLAQAQPVLSPAPLDAPLAPVANNMPPPPFAIMAQAPTPVAAAPAAPFSDSTGMQNYVMSSYQALGAEKGAAIQQVLAGLGCRALNEIKSEHYAALYAGIEALK